mmetsp:Transcript_8684/g.14101  ORF Transcript_8684/g.14101 Transcript_8684/m.14101 type:complete len:87 (-) Transcript_8684:859-1119(-)
MELLPQRSIRYYSLILSNEFISLPFLTLLSFSKPHDRQNTTKSDRENLGSNPFCSTMAILMLLSQKVHFLQLLLEILALEDMVVTG